jgi:hypothetical protein
MNFIPRIGNKNNGCPKCVQKNFYNISAGPVHINNVKPEKRSTMLLFIIFVPYP